MVQLPNWCCIYPPPRIDSLEDGLELLERRVHLEAINEVPSQVYGAIDGDPEPMEAPSSTVCLQREPV